MTEPDLSASHTPDLSASHPTPRGAGTARTGAAVRDVFKTTLAVAERAEVRHAPATAAAAALGETRAALLGAAGIAALGEAVAAALEEKEATAEEEATAYRLELVADSARTLWLQAGGKEWHLDNPTDAVQASVQAAFCCPERPEVVFRYRSDVITELVVQSHSYRVSSSV